MKYGIWLIMFVVCLFIGGATGWVLNIVKLIPMDCGLCGMQVLRIIGIFLAPLGAILGFISN